MTKDLVMGPQRGPEGQNRGGLAPSSPVSSSHTAPSTRTEQKASARPAMETDHSKVQTYADKAKEAMRGVVDSVTPMFRGSTTAPPSSSKYQERPPDHKRREGDTGSRVPLKIPRTSGGADTGEISRGNHGKVEETRGILLEDADAELNESPHTSVRHSGSTHRYGFHGPSYREKEREYRERNKALSAQLQRVEAQNDEYKLQIERMAQINHQLARQGLPLPPPDDHFSREFSQLWSDISQWARLASKRQDRQRQDRPRQEPITKDTWESLSPETHEIISPAFANLDTLLRDPPRNLRTRFIELIIFKELQTWIFGRNVLGLDQSADRRLTKIWQLMVGGKSTTERDLHCWNALSIHLLTKGNEDFQASQKIEVDKLNESLSVQLQPLGAPGLTSFLELRQIVWRVADIGLQIAQLPFIIQPWEVQPGMPFQHQLFEDVENGDDLPEELELTSTPVALVLTPTIVKLEFDSEGKKMNYEATEVAKAVIISKARVVCQL